MAAFLQGMSRADYSNRSFRTDFSNMGLGTEVAEFVMPMQLPLDPSKYPELGK